MAFLPSLLRSRAELEWNVFHSSVDKEPFKLRTASKQAWQEYQTSM